VPRRDDSHQDDTRDVDLGSLLDLATPWCLHVVATLRIADRIAAGVDRIDDLAAAAGCDADALHNVLAWLVGKGVFREEAPGRFGLTPAAEALREATPFLDLDGIGGRMAGAWSTLPTYVRTGRSGYRDVFGLPFWEDLEAHPRVAASFDALMGPDGHGAPDPDVELDGGWDSIRSVVDVGGGTGAFLAELLRAHPGINGTLVDLPGTVERAAAVLAAAGVLDRVTAVGQSFFDPLPAGADLYVLRKVLNDWPARDQVTILHRCADAARPSGRVVVLGGVSADDAPRRLTIEMVLAGGMTNTITMFRDLAAEAGLEVTAAGERRSGTYVVECRPSPSS
jgi:hypothetical protein